MVRASPRQGEGPRFKSERSEDNMLTITTADESQKQFDTPVTVHQVAESIGPGLAKAALAGRVDGTPRDGPCGKSSSNIFVAYSRPLAESTRALCKADFSYDEQADCFHCPCDQRLVLQYEGKDGTRCYQAEATVCGRCPYYDRCCKSRQGAGRTITPQHEKNGASNNDGVSVSGIWKYVKPKGIKQEKPNYGMKMRS